MDAASSSSRCKPQQAVEKWTPKAPSASSSSHCKPWRVAENRTPKALFASPAPFDDSHLASIQDAGADKSSLGKGGDITSESHTRVRLGALQSTLLKLSFHYCSSSSEWRG